ncbi:hypothetical protein CRUP_008742, partial [Coryphaenoides rupestris]
MQQERLLKVLVIGDLGVGKTSVIKRYVHQVFSHHYQATIGVDFALKVALGNGRPVPAVLLANKCDQRGQGLCSKLPKLESFSKDHGFVGWYETSAKDNTNIDAAMTRLVESIMAAEAELVAGGGGEEAETGGMVLPRLLHHDAAAERERPGCN